MICLLLSLYYIFIQCSNQNHRILLFFYCLNFGYNKICMRLACHSLVTIRWNSCPLIQPSSQYLCVSEHLFALLTEPVDGIENSANPVLGTICSLNYCHLKNIRLFLAGLDFNYMKFFSLLPKPIGRCNIVCSVRLTRIWPCIWENWFSGNWFVFIPC